MRIRNKATGRYVGLYDAQDMINENIKNIDFKSKILYLEQIGLRLDKKKLTQKDIKELTLWSYPSEKKIWPNEN